MESDTIIMLQSSNSKIQTNDRLANLQMRNVAFITFWSQFASYSLNTILILYLTMPFLKHGLNMTQTQAYLFFGVINAVGYLMPIAGGFVADNLLGVRRSILFGSILLAIAYSLVMFSGHFSYQFGRDYFIATYALVPVSSSFLLGSSSAIISKIYATDEYKAKKGMTLYYMSINIGSLLATLIAPPLLDSRWGPLSVFVIVSLGKILSAINFATRYKCYDSIVEHADKQRITLTKVLLIAGYFIVVYAFTLFCFFNPNTSSYTIGLSGLIGFGTFLYCSVRLKGIVRKKQLISIFLILVAIVFFVLYAQMSTTMIFFAKNNSNLKLFSLHVSPASYQMVNPLAIMLLGSYLPRLYKRYPRFSIPYQFCTGIFFAGLGMFILYLAHYSAVNGLISGNYIALSYFSITLGEMLVSAIGLSMIGLYCSNRMISFAMGVFYLASALSNLISAKLAGLVALPNHIRSAQVTLSIYSDYYLKISLLAFGFGLILFLACKLLIAEMKKQGLILP